MKRLLALLLALLCVCAMLPAASATSTVPCLTVDSSLVIIGDSNTVFLKKNNTDIQPARIYARVNATIAECVQNYSSYHADGYSKGMYQLISGLSGSSFKTVVINIGTNNAGTATSTFQAKYRQLLNLLYQKNPEAVIYVCKILPINPSHYSGSYPSVFTLSNINRINNAVAALQAEYAAKGYDTRIMDLFTPFQNAYGVLMPEYDSGGGIHLTVAGYKRLNKVVQTALAQGDPDANHSWGSAKVLKAATCVEEGQASCSCTRCGAVKSLVIPASGAHSWGSPVTLAAPSCTADGLRRSSCTVCKAVRDETLPALGHCWVYLKTLSPASGELHGTAQYRCERCGYTKSDLRCASVAFSDMPAEGNWAHAPIDWAYFGGLTAGKGEGRFAPNDTITRAEVLSFLWTVAGRPTPEAGENPFTDVPENKYFYKPVMWAVARGITSGVEANRFGPGEKCTRGQIMTFLWIAAGRPEPKSAGNPFTDVPTGKYYYKPVLWAVENNVTGGTGAGTFSPNAVCTRAQVLAFLYKTEAILKAAES